MTDDPAIDPTEEIAPGEAGGRDAEVRRAIAIAEEAGLKSYRVEIAPDGTITLFVGDPAQDRVGV